MNSTYLTVRTNITSIGITRARNWGNGLIITYIVEPIIEWILKLEHGEIILFISGAIVVGFVIKEMYRIENSLPEDQQAVNIVREYVNKNIPENARRASRNLRRLAIVIADTIIETVLLPAKVAYNIANYFFISPFLSLTN